MAEQVVKAVDTPESCHFVVGIGASAGGLDALKALFGAMPARPEAAFIVVQHLAKDAGTPLVGLLGDVTSLPVLSAEDGLVVECNRVYIAPPQTIVTVCDGVFEVRDAASPEERRRTIDPMLHSLAREYGPRGVGIILSGNDQDGTEGLLLIKREGGLGIAQDPQTAQFDIMPRSAIESGAVDCALAPGDMAAKLVAYYSDLVTMESADRDAAQEKIAERLGDIARLVRDAVGHDFSQYKTSTLVRRIQRRMRVVHITDIDAYIERLRDNVEEGDALFREILISVTSFFRDPEAFKVLAQRAIRPIVEGRYAGEDIRVWVPGCATGEEAYSIAILFCEAFDALEVVQRPAVRIFATDIDEEGLQASRRGVYSRRIERDVSPARLERFFKEHKTHYTVTRQIRDMCVFAEHNIIRDPAFIDLDLISCRNLFIYLGPELQEQLLLLFHHCLRPKGFLFLGSSESVSPHGELFAEQDGKNRLWQNTARMDVPRPRLPMNMGRYGRRHLDGRETGRRRDYDLHAEFQRLMTEKYAPRAAVVRQDGHLVYASSGLERYFEIVHGQFHSNLVKMIKSGLRLGLRTALKQAVSTNCRVTQERLSYEGADGPASAKIIVEPMPADSQGESAESTGLYLVVLEDTGPALDKSQLVRDGSVGAEALIDQLEQELESTRRSLEESVQDLETTNEELKSSNEELRSMNEELQSANEELEASKSVVEHANERLGQAKADLENLMHTAQFATLFLDPEHNIKMFTPSMADIYPLRPGDVNRPLEEMAHRALEMPPLPDGESLYEAGRPAVDQLQLQDGRWFVRRVLPYRAQKEQEAGMVVTFTDISALKETALALEERTLSLEQARLDAEAASRAKSEFLANMSHEIRTPLTAIMGFTDLLRKRNDDAETREALDVIKRNATFLLDIVNEILDLAKVEAGRLTIATTRYSPREVIEDLVSSMSLRTKRKGVPIVLDYAPQVPEILIGDPTRLRQILLNLLGNAIKFTNEGRIEIKVGFDDREQPRLRCAVIDTGIGMSEAEQELIFEPFSQGDGSVTRRYGGTGLGLAITRRLVDKLGGTLTVESELGQGSTFVIELPVEVPPAGAEETLPEVPRTDGQQGSRGPTGSLKDLRVLAVDDNEGIREIVSLFLAPMAAVVETASSGFEAIEKVEAASRADEPFDVIVMDMQMPDLDGYEATRRLRANGFDKPIIALTASAMHGDDERCFAAGCTGYLAKPFEPDELITSVVGQSEMYRGD